MDEIERIVAGLQPSLAEGRVGFFWIVRGRSGKDKVLGESISLAEAEHYGQALTHPGGHYDFWEAMKARGPAWLRNRDLSAVLLTTEYEDWPRGRVVFHTDKTRFSLMLDRRLRTPSRLAMIQKEFQLSDGYFDVNSDGHYQSVRT